MNTQINSLLQDTSNCQLQRDITGENGTIENSASVAYREGRLVAVLNEQEQTMHVVRRSITSDPELVPEVEMELVGDLQSVVRRGTALMLLRKLGLEKFYDV